MSIFSRIVKAVTPSLNQAPPRRRRKRKHAAAAAAEPTAPKKGGVQLSDAERLAIVEAYSVGGSVSDIASAYGVSEQAVRKLLTRVGVYRPRGNPAAGPTDQIDQVVTGVEKLGRLQRAVRNVTGADDPPPPVMPYRERERDYEPSPDDEYDREMRRLEVAERRMQLEARRRAMDSPAYQQALEQRALDEARGRGGRRERDDDPVGALIGRMEQIEQLRAALGVTGGGGGQAEGDEMPGWAKAARLVLEPLAPILNQLGGQILQPSSRPPASVERPYIPATATPPPWQPAAAAAAPPPASSAPPARPAGEEEQPQVINRATPIEFQLFRPIFTALLPHVDKTPEEAAALAYAQLIEWEETAPALDLMGMALFRMPVRDVMMLASAYREDKDLGDSITWLLNNPSWAIAWYAAAQELLDSSGDEQEDEEQDDEGAPESEGATMTPP